jgi:hypothetical protein
MTKLTTKLLLTLALTLSVAPSYADPLVSDELANAVRGEIEFNLTHPECNEWQPNPGDTSDAAIENQAQSFVQTHPACKIRIGQRVDLMIIVLRRSSRAPSEIDTRSNIAVGEEAEKYDSLRYHDDASSDGSCCSPRSRGRSSEDCPGSS